MDRMISAAPPKPHSGFHWAPSTWGYRLQADALTSFPHGWTTRQLALRGTPEIEADAWSQLAEAGGVSIDQVVRLHQVHDAGVHVPTMRDGLVRPEADAAISRDPYFLLTVQVADCVPLLIADPRSGAVGVAHAGWRGTAAGVARAALNRLASLVPLDSLAAAIGPSIGPCCYRVGAELIDSFRQAGWAAEAARWFERRGDGWYLDLWRANAEQLTQHGVHPDAVHVCGLCTACHPDWFFSYRRDGARTGRMVGYIRSAG
jgi:hypothetical protein